MCATSSATPREGPLPGSLREGDQEAVSLVATFATFTSENKTRQHCAQITVNVTFKTAWRKPLRNTEYTLFSHYRMLEMFNIIFLITFRMFVAIHCVNYFVLPARL